MEQLRYASYNRYLRERFGAPVRKITVNAGFTCPTRDGTAGREGCLYCDNRSFSPNLRQPALPIAEQVKKGQEILRRKFTSSKFIVYFQPFTNTYAPPPVLRERYHQAFVDDSIVGIAVGTRPDCLSEETINVLEELSRTTYLSLEIGLQSAHNTTLTRINRGHTVEQFADAVRRCRRRSIEICTHVILGLPGETPGNTRATAQFISAQDVQGVKIHALYACKNTFMEKEYQSGNIRFWEEEEYVSAAVDFLEHLRPDIYIHRLSVDVRQNYLVAPAWVLHKQKVIRAINNELAARDTCQGKKNK